MVDAVHIADTLTEAAEGGLDPTPDAASAARLGLPPEDLGPLLARVEEELSAAKALLTAHR